MTCMTKNASQKKGNSYKEIKKKRERENKGLL